MHVVGDRSSGMLRSMYIVESLKNVVNKKLSVTILATYNIRPDNDFSLKYRHSTAAFCFYFLFSGEWVNLHPSADNHLRLWTWKKLNFSTAQNYKTGIPTSITYDDDVEAVTLLVLYPAGVGAKPCIPRTRYWSVPVGLFVREFDICHTLIS